MTPRRRAAGTVVALLLTPLAWWLDLGLEPDARRTARVIRPRRRVHLDAQGNVLRREQAPPPDEHHGR